MQILNVIIIKIIINIDGQEAFTEKMGGSSE